MEITRDILKSLIKEELTKATLGELDLPDRGFDAKQWDYARAMLDDKIKSVLQDKESQALNIDDKKIMRVMRGLNNVIGQNPSQPHSLHETLNDQQNLNNQESTDETNIQTLVDTVESQLNLKREIANDPINRVVLSSRHSSQQFNNPGPHTLDQGLDGHTELFNDNN